MVRSAVVPSIGPQRSAAWSRDCDISTLRRAREPEGRALAVRNLVDRAKGLLVVQDRLSEQEAVRRIQKTSIDTRSPMAEVAWAVILAAQVRSPAERS
jgi:two-component system, response regulator PdtaR